MIVIHNRNSQKSRDFIKDVPTGTKIVDYFCKRTDNGKGKYIASENMETPELLTQYDNPPIRTFPCQLIEVPAHYDATRKQNIDDSQEVTEFQLYQAAKDYETLMLEQAMVSPPLPDNQIPAQTPLVLEPLNQAAGMMQEAFNEVLNND